MITISLCMIVKDEEDVLSRCLDSVKDLVDEIIIVDTGSKDKTKEIAGKYTSKVYDFEWIDNFSAARNYSFSLASMDFILWLDADDVIYEEDRRKFKMIKEIMDPNIDVVMMKYNLGTDERGNPSLTFYRERLLKRSKDFKWFDPVHEYINFGGRVVNSDVSVTHKKTRSSRSRNLEIVEKLIKKGGEFDPRHVFYYARELFFNGKLDEAIVYYNKFIEYENQYSANYLDSFIDLSKIYKIKGDNKNSLRMLFRSFEYVLPRAEICCMIGYHYKDLEDYIRAIFWFDFATKLKKPENEWGFVIHDCWGFIPYFELSTCSFKLGNINDAVKYNNKALEYKSGNEEALHNRELFERVLSYSQSSIK